MKHTLTILLQNEAGALGRVIGLFGMRHCNIDTLFVTTTHDPAVSQLTVVIEDLPCSREQITRQLGKLVDVIRADSLPHVPDVSIPPVRALAS